MTLRTVLESGLFDTITGLPVHPLAVHAAVVLLPLAAAGTIILAFSKRLRGRYGWLVIALYAVAGVFAFIAKESGEALAHRVGEPRTHAFWGDVVPVIALGALVLALAWFVVQNRADKAGRASMAGTLLGIVAAVASVAALVVTVLAGHSGAVAVWGDATESTDASASPAVSQSPTPTAAATTASPAGPSSSPVATQSAGTYTLAQVATHANATSCWSVVNGKVYDLTKWITAHPGGERRILGMCGKDATAAFTAEHGDSAKAIKALEGFEIGRVG